MKFRLFSKKLRIQNQLRFPGKLQSVIDEYQRVRKLESELDKGLIDPVFIARATQNK